MFEEFGRNKARVIAESKRSLQTHFRLVCEAVNRFAGDGYKAETLEALNEVDHKIGVTAGAVSDSIELIEDRRTLADGTASADD